MGIDSILYAIYAILGISGIIGALKCIDWLIGIKYKTKDDCEKCRADIYNLRNSDKNLLTSLNTKIDIIMDYFNLTPKNKEDK